MRKTIIVAACGALLVGPAFAQTTQPQGGATSEMSKGAVKKGKSTTGMSGKTKEKTQTDGMKSKAPKY